MSDVSQAVKWAEDVVDNELLNKKSSKSEYSRFDKITVDFWILLHMVLPLVSCRTPVVVLRTV